TIQRSMPKPSPGPALGMALKGVYCDQPEMGAPPVTKNAETITRNERAVPQAESMLSKAKHISRAPIWSGTKQFPKACCGAVVKTKKTINVRCKVTSAR